MKFLVVLTLLGLAAAKPQLILPYTSPLLTPTIQTPEGAPATYTASYPYSGFPFVQAALPYNQAALSYNQAALPYSYGFPYSFSPFATAARPAAVEVSRAKRDADPEPEADPALVYTTGLTGSAINYPITALPTTGINYQYSGIPAAVSTYTYPQQQIPYTGVTPFTGGLTPFTGFHPFTGVSPYTAGVSPYTSFPFYTPFVSTAEAATPEDASVARAKRSADPEADPQLLTTAGFTGFTYPAVNTHTTYNTFPNTFPTTSFTHPTTYSNNYPFHYGTYPFAGGYITGK